MVFPLRNTFFAFFILIVVSIRGQYERFYAWCDSSAKHKTSAGDIATLYADSAMSYAREKNDPVILAGAYNAVGNAYLNKGHYQLALDQFKLGEKYARLKNKRQLLAKIINNKALCYERMGNYKKTFEMHFLALTIRQELKIPNDIALSYQNIGVTYFYIGDIPSCINVTQKAIEIEEKEKNYKFLGQLYGNLGICYFQQYKDSLTFDAYRKALHYSKLGKDLNGEAAVYINLSSFYNDVGQPAKAKNYLMKALALENFDNPEKTIDVYINLGNVYKGLHLHDSAIYYYGKAVKQAKELGFKRKILDAYNVLFNYYKEKEDYKNALEYKTLFHLLNDTLVNEKNLKNIAEFETIYKTEKKNKEIELLNAENKIQKEKTENNKRLLWVSLCGLLLAILAAVAFYRNFARKKKDNVLLQEKNVQIQKQKHLIEEKNKEIVDSINYAKRLQEAILPPVELIQKQLPQSFVLYMPKDIVAGDFYWTYLISRQQAESSMQAVNSSMPPSGDCLLIAVGDCTGHGVPGAMVSVVCANAMNAAVKEFGLREPAKILDKVSELVEQTFEKSASEVKDGMDISLVKITAINENPENKLQKGKLVIPKGKSLSDVIEENKKYEIEWAGANNPLWYIKSGEWQEIKADKQPVGKFDNRKPFTLNRIELKAGDSFFLFSDGFADQFGGKDGKKIKNKNLKEFLYKNASLPSQQQKEILEREFNSWKSNYEQVDDVCIIGVRL